MTTPDPLLRDVRCDHSAVLPVLGIPTAFESNSAVVLDVVEEAFGGWRVVDGFREHTEPLRVRLIAIEGDEPGGSPLRVRHLVPDTTRLVVQSSGSVAVSDPMRREVHGWVTTGLLAERELFRTAFLEAATLALLSHFDRHPVHAAAIARDDRAVLLVGASGSGKSTLAHLADCAGIDVLSEDHVWIQLAPNCRAWGWPGYVRLLTGNSANKNVVSLRGRDRAACYSAHSVRVCLLGRGERARLERVDSETLIAALTRDVAPGFDRFPERHTTVARALALDGGWRLSLTTDPNDALPLLEEMLNAP